MVKRKRLDRGMVEDIVDEKTSFEDTICLIDGLLVQTDEDGKMYTEENQDLKPEDMVTIRFNKKVFERISKYSKAAFGMRGIKDINSIDVDDPDVKELLKKWKKRQTAKFLKRSEENRQARLFIETVVREHRPHYMTTIFQVMSWAMLYDDIFEVKANQIDCRLEIDIDEDYWGRSGNEDKELDALLQDYTASEVLYDRTNPLEIMLAIVTMLINEYPDFAEALTPYYQKVYVATNILSSANEFDDAGFLRSKLDELLLEVVDGEDGIEEREDLEPRSSRDEKKARGRPRKPVERAEEADSGTE